MGIKLSLCFLLISAISFGQEIDTITFFSKTFNEQRSVYVHKPNEFKYKSDSVKLPVIFLLDGQHEWFINPIISDIEYLQYTHQIPKAIVVVIPHNDRNKECAIVDLETRLPLDIFMREELNNEIQKYNPNDFKLIIGHSYSASFSLYSYFLHPNFYSGVIAHSPLDRLEMLVENFEKSGNLEEYNISISIGGVEKNKDYHHRRKYNDLKLKYPEFFNSVNLFEADQSAHNAVPITSSPTFLTNLFEAFSSRYSEIAMVNEDYELISEPEEPSKAIEKILSKSRLGRHFYPPEIAEINGMASRFWNSQYNDIAFEIYDLGVKYYPNYYEFHLFLYELTIDKNKDIAKNHLAQAENLLNTVEKDWEEKNEIVQDIKKERIKNGW